MLTGQARVQAQELGKLESLPPLPEIERKTDFMGLIEGIRQGLVEIEQHTKVLRVEQKN